MKFNSVEEAIKVIEESHKKCKEANQIKELENDVLMIELYEDPMQAGLPKTGSFNKLLGIILIWNN